ncbi:MAG TPA: hypothetical protein VFC53_06690 [Dehalococcoidia bacterium]|jgi:hypothetical protein|nr:hypothetical protein [Dehalococcoidia bacterium]
MTTPRTVLPTDLVALVSYDGHVYSNEAMTADRTGKQASPHPLETAFEQWFSFATGRHTWISVKGATLRGLISARKRGSKLAWEVDCLIDATEDDTAVLLGLFDQVTHAAGKSGALRVFLRVPAGSHAERMASRCEFAPYLRERVWRRDLAGVAAEASPLVRRRAKGDLYPLFRLYNEVVPERVRKIEAMTLAEWTAAQEHLGRTSHYVLEGEGRLRGSLRVAADGDLGRFEVLADGAGLEPLLDTALAKLANRARAFVLVPDYLPELETKLAARGFEAAEEFAVLCRRTAHVLKAPRPLPALIGTNLI